MVIQLMTTLKRLPLQIVGHMLVAILEMQFFYEKLSAVTRYLEGMESYISIGRSIGTSQNVVMNWVKKYQGLGIEGLKKKATQITQQVLSRYT